MRVKSEVKNALFNTTILKNPTPVNSRQVVGRFTIGTCMINA